MPTKHKKSSKQYKKTQKLWNMRGCALHKQRRKRMGSKLVRKMIGGSCDTCKSQLGGSVPPPLVGSPWTSNPNSWGVTNYFSNNTLQHGDPQTQGIISERSGQIYNGSGGSRRRRRYNNRTHGRHKRGGGLIPQSLANVGNNIMFGAGSAYNALLGYPPPMNPNPTFQPKMMM